jgi:hypothetical protein
VVKKKILPLLLLVSLSTCNTTDLKIYKIDDEVVDTRAQTLDGSRWGMAINGKSFQQNAIISHGAYQYLAYYDARRNVCLSRRKLSEGPWETYTRKTFSSQRYEIWTMQSGYHQLPKINGVDQMQGRQYKICFI